MNLSFNRDYFLFLNFRLTPPTRALPAKVARYARLVGSPVFGTVVVFSFPDSCSGFFCSSGFWSGESGFSSSGFWSGFSGFSSSGCLFWVLWSFLIWCLLWILRCFFIRFLFWIFLLLRCFFVWILRLCFLILYRFPVTFFGRNKDCFIPRFFHQNFFVIRFTD